MTIDARALRDAFARVDAATTTPARARFDARLRAGAAQVASYEDELATTCATSAMPTETLRREGERTVMRLSATTAREREREARGDWDRGDRDDGDGRDRYAGRMRSDREGPYDRPRWRDGADARSTVRERAATRKTEHSVKVEDLPRGADWRDVKDAFRRAGRVTYASTFVDRD